MISQLHIVYTDEVRWDENKRLINLHKHGLDFADAYLVSDSNFVEMPARTEKGEARFYAVGLMDDQLVTAVFTKRDGAICLISMRRPRRGERARHSQLFGQ